MKTTFLFKNVSIAKDKKGNIKRTNNNRTH